MGVAVVFIIAVISLASVIADSCSSDANYQLYNISKIANKNFYSTYNNYKYFGNICNPLLYDSNINCAYSRTVSCLNSYPGITALRYGTDAVGNYQIAPINKDKPGDGVKITVSGGDVCEWRTSPPWVTVYTINCDKNGPVGPVVNSFITQLSPNCEARWTLSSSAVCLPDPPPDPEPNTSDGATISTAVFFIIFAVVVGGGCTSGIVTICVLMCRDKGKPLAELPYEERLIAELIQSAEGKCAQPAMKKYYGPGARQGEN